MNHAAPSLCLLTLMACTPVPTAPETGPTLSVGIGSLDFLPLVDGQAIPVNAGPQGGYHVPAAVRLCGLVAPTTVALEIWEPAAQAQLARIDYELIALHPTADEQCGFAADLWLYLDVEGTLPDSLDGRSVELSATCDGGPGSVADTVSGLLFTGGL